MDPVAEGRAGCPSRPRGKTYAYTLQDGKKVTLDFPLFVEGQRTARSRRMSSAVMPCTTRTASAATGRTRPKASSGPIFDIPWKSA